MGDRSLNLPIVNPSGVPRAPPPSQKPPSSNGAQSRDSHTQTQTKAGFAAPPATHSTPFGENAPSSNEILGGSPFHPRVVAPPPSGFGRLGTNGYAGPPTAPPWYYGHGYGPGGSTHHSGPRGGAPSPPTTWGQPP